MDTAQEFLQEWEKKNNPFYPKECKWDRLIANKFAKAYDDYVKSHAETASEIVGSVGEIIISKLKEIGADGLCTDGCGCSLDDLAPCGACIIGNDGIPEDCVPALRVIAKESGECYDAGDEIFIPLDKHKSCKAE